MFPRARLVRPLARGVIALALSTTARADVLLHEYIAPDANEDLRLGATTADGTMAAAIQTQSGPVGTPDLEHAPRSGTVYGGSGAQGAGAYHVDRDTTRPETVSYSDPFTPAVAPYKRDLAYDGVDERADLIVRDPALVRLPVGGAPRREDDQFYADLQVDLPQGQPVRIPTVGPSARLLAARAAPAQPLEFFHDGAENWYVKSAHEGRVRLILHIAIDRGVFGSSFADVDWARLYRFVPPVPEAVKNEGVRVARQIGVVDGTGPAEALRILVKHFREFAPSDDRPKSAGLALYRELATSQKGVCRHRSYAFVVTALALGLPARFVRNEAHAWVEVFDGERWHRIDLGGAADRLDYSDENRVAHVPPRDPYEWPTRADSGQAMAERARTAHSGGQGGQRSGAASNGAAPAPAATAEEPPEAEDARPKATVTVDVGGAEARRGARLRVSGRVDAAAATCAQVRVDLFLEPSNAPRDRLPLGTLVTNDEGRYDGRVVVPFGVPPGDYDVRATTPGNLACGRGQSR